MREEGSLSKSLDWITIGFYLLFFLMGWLNIYASVYNSEVNQTIFDPSIRSGQQFIWFCISGVVILLIMVIDYKFYNSFAFVIYGAIIAVLILTIFIAPDIKGSRSWLAIGSFRVQPAEFAKFATALALSRFLGEIHVKWSQDKTKAIVAGILALPAVIILLQQETGSMLVFAAFLAVLYREGLSGWIFILGFLAIGLFIFTLIYGYVDVLIILGILFFLVIAFYVLYTVTTRKNIRWRPLLMNVLKTVVVYVGCCIWAFSIGKVFEILQPHQQNRVKVLVFGPEVDPTGVGYNVNQSMIAIGSGSFLGKGYLNGTQTKLNYVPEQSTDFIFCTVGEEHGWLGSSFVIILYVLFLLRLIHLAERQKDKFSRIYGYCVTSIFFFHFMVNIGMTIGIFPVIGIPLPFFSYGGSSLLSFTILLFILLKLDAHRKQVLWH